MNHSNNYDTQRPQPKTTRDKRVNSLTYSQNRFPIYLIHGSANRHELQW